MKFAILTAAAAAVLALGLAAALPAFADDDDMRPERLKRLDDRAADRSVKVSRLEAMDIARSKGMAHIREIDLDDNDDWEIEGRTAEGREIEIEISARDGRVKELEIDD